MTLMSEIYSLLDMDYLKQKIYIKNLPIPAHFNVKP